MSRGRRAALPPEGFQPQHRLRTDQDTLVVRFVPEDGGGQFKDYDFTALPIARPLQEPFARALLFRTRPGSRLRATQSADTAFRILTSFARYLSTLVRSPEPASHLTVAHVDGWLLRRSHIASALKELGDLKASLRRIPGISPEFAAAMHHAHRRPTPPPTTRTYTRDEFRRILSAARFDVRTAAERIRAGRALLAQWRSGEIDQEEGRRWRQGYLLDYVERHADVPRYTTGRRPVFRWVQRLGGVDSLFLSLHLGPADAAAFAVLLVGLTGQNAGTIVSAPAAHHRPDGHTGTIASAVVEFDKPRRGSRRYMDVALVDLPDWVTAPSEEEVSRGGHDDLRSAFGVYMLLHDLAAPGRRELGTERLLVWWAAKGGFGTGPGWRNTLHSDRVKDWGRGHDLPGERVAEQADQAPAHEGSAKSKQLRVTLSQLRRTYLELRQRPVAHTERTLADDYLLRDRGNIAEYRQIVADTLEKEVAKARTRAALRALSAAEVEQARTDPTAVAADHGLDSTVLQRMLDGELDTVMAACADHTHGPHAPAGQPCRASFMLCLSCPCARALPHHLPLQVAVHDALTAKHAAMTPLRWAQRFALPHAQLADLLARTGDAAVADARANLTGDQQELVARFLNRELDLS